MSNDDESKTPTLDYQNPAKDRTPRGVHAVLLFVAGFALALLAVGIGSAFFGGAVIAVTGSNAGGPFFVAIIFVVLGFIVAVAAVRRLRQTRGQFFILGFLCGSCILLLTEGLCFGGIALDDVVSTDCHRMPYPVRADLTASAALKAAA